ncbi:hypothetical protein QBC34DRAFT_470325 [Podospora aff. communis PSN243]|uniref:Rhodopsin domain-containing protein n=1 Tax=Podospora aff. communis PSN243 TaxID=3040156 RepID=A0AAV9GGP6_9PEZI|nr:hypothetical protein QBC34DRAFT_470325 [Podospora aff. communis PSN243]
MSSKPDAAPELFVPISARANYLARVHTGVCAVLLALCLVPFTARFYTRIRPTLRLGWDDLLIAMGFALVITDFALLQFEMALQPGAISIPTVTHAVKLAYLAIPVWVAAMTFIKLSVVLTLLRIPVNRIWTFFLYTVAALQVAYFIGNFAFSFTQCRPLAAVWDPVLAADPSSHCLGATATRITSNVSSGVNTATDLALSLAPMVILWKLRRPMRERILVCALMAVGLLASASSLVKAIIIQEWGNPDVDGWALAESIATWTVVEQELAVIAACSPSLKGPLQRFLGKIGILLTRYDSRVSFMTRPDTTLARAVGVGRECKREWHGYE